MSDKYVRINMGKWRKITMGIMWEDKWGNISGIIEKVVEGPF